MDQEASSGRGFVTPFLVGALVGGVAALLLAPCSGTELRTKIRNRFGKLKDQGEDLLDEAEDTLSKKADEVGNALNKRM